MEGKSVNTLACSKRSTEYLKVHFKTKYIL